MTKQVFDQISEGLSEAIGIAEGKLKPFKMHVPPDIDVKTIRTKTGMSQKDFASTFGFGLDQLKQWEQGRNRPVQGLRAYLLLISSNPMRVMEWLAREQSVSSNDDNRIAM